MYAGGSGECEYGGGGASSVCTGRDAASGRLSGKSCGIKDGEAMPKKSSTALSSRAREVRMTAAGGLGIRMCSNSDLDGDWASMSPICAALEALKRAGMRKVEEVELRADMVN